MPTTDASKPWSPTAIAVLTLVFSPVVGGVLHALNYGRLGRGEFRRYALARNLFAGTMLLAILLGTSFSRLGVSLFSPPTSTRLKRSTSRSISSRAGRKPPS